MRGEDFFACREWGTATLAMTLMTLSFQRPKGSAMTHNDPHSRAADAVHEGRPVEEQFVKQGRGGRRITLVLIVAFVLTALGFLIVQLVYAPDFAAGDANAGQQAVDAAAFQGAGGDSVPAADAPTTSTGEPTNPATGEAPNVNAPTVQAAPSGQ
jgi:cytoskeletal protein RodZ